MDLKGQKIRLCVSNVDISTEHQRFRAVQLDAELRRDLAEEQKGAGMGVDFLGHHHHHHYY